MENIKANQNYNKKLITSANELYNLKDEDRIILESKFDSTTTLKVKSINKVDKYITFEEECTFPKREYSLYVLDDSYLELLPFKIYKIIPEKVKKDVKAEQTITKDDNIKPNKETKSTYKLSELISLMEEGKIKDGTKIKRKDMTYKVKKYNNGYCELYNNNNNNSNQKPLNIFEELFGEDVQIIKPETYDVINMLQMLKDDPELVFEDINSDYQVFVENGKILMLCYDTGLSHDFSIGSLDDLFTLIDNK